MNFDQDAENLCQILRQSSNARFKKKTYELGSLLWLRMLYGIGGAQAIAALAYGTQSIAPVDKIVDPGETCFIEAAFLTLHWERNT